MECISRHWDVDDQRSIYSCPECEETFTPKPSLNRNYKLTKVVEELKKTKRPAASPAHCYAGPGDVECDSCTGRKRKALKSCLVCQASYCKDHLKPHYQSPAFKKHKLVEAKAERTKKQNEVKEEQMKSQQRIQEKQKKVQELKQTVDSVKNELKEEQVKFQQRIQEKQKKVQELKQTVDTIKIRSQAAVDDSERSLLADQLHGEKALGDQDQFSCPVCLDLLKDPVTTPCGHNFCKVCINGFWDKEDQRSVYSCPQCRETFTPKPAFRRNNMLAEVVEELKKTEMSVKCDSCIGRKRKAVKSCLVCLASYCEDHLHPHYQSPAFKKHKLIEACAELQEKICSEHDKLMEIYCRTDQSFICYLCTMDKHKGHDTVAAKAEKTEKQNELKEEQMKSQQRIQEKQKKVQELKQTMDTIKTRSQAAVDDSGKIFTELISSMEKKHSEVAELIRRQEKAELSRAERLLNQLEQEIADLKRRVTELEQLTHTHDHIHFLQSFPSLCVSPGCDDSPSFTLNLSFDGVRKSLSDLKKRVDEICEEEFNKIHPQAAAAQEILSSEPKINIHNLQYVKKRVEEVLLAKMRPQGKQANIVMHHNRNEKKASNKTE
ncbi:hypothetical protein QTP70_019253 [Hemibagrus guttatus]|uniref:E3 ubiquitin/ISG15 ligase TRIM25-like n=1 Tax=Hemibagrus guttatus TaxID=175788 RepID=A0AAE0V1T9_9TELE|nr:hypothetical protein QTP70_019253 [Hemibagrus guttatus]